MGSGTERLLLFTLQGTRYALDLKAVAEVLPPPVTFPVPWAAPSLKGAMNFHGTLVAVLDLAEFMGNGTMAPHGNVLVLDRSIANLALWVDRVDAIVPVDGVLEEDQSSDTLVDRILIMADGEVNMLAVGVILERLEETMKR